jgi:hypothetical protein
MSKAAELANLIGNINAGGGGVNRNLIINGAMNVSQRGTSFADPSNDDYVLDRFIARKSNDGAVTITQDSSAPSGFANSLKVDVTTADTSIGASQFSMVQHKIEAQNLQGLAFGTSDAKNFTISFYVKSNKTGTYAVNVSQSDNSGKQATLTYTIDSANTWERKSVTFTGDTSGVINDDNGTGFGILWWLAAGSNFTSGSASATFQAYANADAAAGQAVNVLDSTDNTWFITGVQLEVGQNPTEFEHEPYETTLRKCQRYLLRYPNDGGTNGGYTRYGTGQIVASNEAEISIYPPVHMRVDPSLTIGGSASDYYIWNANDADSCSALSVEGGSTHEYIVINVAGANMTAGRGCMLNAYGNSTNFMQFDAEL